MRLKTNKKKVIKTKQATTCVMINSRDARTDRVLPLDIVIKMYNAGQLFFDTTNKMYGSDVDLPQFPMRG